jgi:hypothetical protein
MQSSTYLPELLTRILPTNPLQDLRTARMLIHKSIHLVNAIVDYNVQALVDIFVLRDLLRCERIGHGS